MSASKATLPGILLLLGACQGTPEYPNTLEMTTWSVAAIDPITGDVGVASASCVPSFGDALAALVHDRIISRYHHRHLNLDVEDYVDLVPTGENIVRRMWDLLEGSVPGARPSTSGRARLHRLRLIETRDNSFEYSGGQG